MATDHHHGHDHHDARQDGGTGRRTALITGGTGSLGFHTAQAILAGGGWDVVVTGRSADSARTAAARLGDRATGWALDMGTLAEVRRVARELPVVDAVVCNAGVHTTAGTAYTDDGVEQTFGVNHLAHFLLVQELLPRLASPARVVFVSSGTHDPARRTGFPAPRYTTARDLAVPDQGPGEPHGESPFRTGRRRYTTSKLCKVLATYEFARRVSSDVATFNAFDPGQMPGTGIARDYGGIRGFAWRHVLPALAHLPRGEMRTPQRSAAALARLVVDPAFDGPRDGTSTAPASGPRRTSPTTRTRPGTCGTPASR